MEYKTVELAWFRDRDIEYAATRTFEKHAGKGILRVSEYTEVTFELLPQTDVTAELNERRLAAIAYHEAQVAMLKHQAE
jgi:hypothetical protein